MNELTLHLTDTAFEPVVQDSENALQRLLGNMVEKDSLVGSLTIKIDIAKITDTKSGLSDEFTKLNFERSNYKDSTVRKLPCYLLTRDGSNRCGLGKRNTK